jgi:hypothetical protein
VGKQLQPIHVLWFVHGDALFATELYFFALLCFLSCEKMQVQASGLQKTACQQKSDIQDQK